MRRRTFKIWIMGVLIGSVAGCQTDPAADIQSVIGAAPEVSGPTGGIRGVVRLIGDPPPAEYDEIQEDQHVCGDSVLLPRLSLGDGNGVQDAFVYLDGDGLDSVRYGSMAEATVSIDQEDCQYVPHAVVAPIGARLVASNSDPILHNVHGRESGDGGLRTIFNIAQPVQGQRTTINTPLTRPGILTLSCEAGHPWMSAYIFVAEHPYVTVTSESGEFVLENVPVGTYRIAMWHQGVRLTGIVRSLQRYEYEAPYEVTTEVTVEPDAETVVEFVMALRPETNGGAVRGAGD